MDNASTRAQLLEHFLSFFMPEGILDVWAQSQSLDSRESKKDILYTGTLHIYLDERDNRTDEMQALRIVSHGTMQVSRTFQPEILTSPVLWRRSRLEGAGAKREKPPPGQVDGSRGNCL